MNDERYWPVLGTWLKDTAKAPPDPRQSARRVAERLPQTPQLSRHWWLPSRRQVSAPLAAVGPARRHTPNPAPIGHTPTVTGRTSSMLSPAKAITAGAIVFAIGGAMLIAQPFDQRGASVPGAAADDPAMAPSFFSGSPGEDWVHTAPVTERRDDGVIDGRGESYTVSWEANDPRISGTASISLNETDYRTGATTLAPTGDVGSIRTYLLRIVNDDGAWDGQLQELVLEPEFSSNSGWLTGTGAYEGLSAYLVWSVSDDLIFHGHITPEGPPPAPASVPE